MTNPAQPRAEQQQQEPAQEQEQEQVQPEQQELPDQSDVVRQTENQGWDGTPPGVTPPEEPEAAENQEAE